MIELDLDDANRVGMYYACEILDFGLRRGREKRVAQWGRPDLIMAIADQQRERHTTQGSVLVGGMVYLWSEEKGID